MPVLRDWKNAPMRLRPRLQDTENLDVRLARLEERADETATQIAGTENLDVRLARLEERADEAATHMAGNQKAIFRTD